MKVTLALICMMEALRKRLTDLLARAELAVEADSRGEYATAAEAYDEVLAGLALVKVEEESAIASRIQQLYDQSVLPPGLEPEFVSHIQIGIPNGAT